MAALKKRQFLADGLLLLVALVWGGTFIMVQDAVAGYPVLAFLALRFGLAALALLPFGWRRLRSLGWRGVGSGALLGLLLFSGYGFQTFGLRHTTSSKVGLITGLSVVLVPLLTALILRRRPRLPAIMGVALAACGLVLLTFEGRLDLQTGDALAAVCALCFALHIVSVAAFAPKSDPIALTLVQVLTVSLLSLAASLLTEGPLTLPNGQAWFAAAFTGILATAAAFLAQTALQRLTTPTHTALIFTAEPVFAAIFGVILAGEAFLPLGIVGGVLIILGMLLSEIPWSETTARVISRFLAPQYVMVALLLVLALTDPISQWRGLAWAAAVGIVSVGIPLAFFWRRFRQGGISDWHISRREERLQPAVVIGSILAPLLPILLLYWLEGPRAMLIGLTAALVMMLVNLLVTLRWKISQHTSAVAASTTLVTALLGVAALPVMLLVPLVAWARVKVGAHTIAQTVAGSVVGLTVTLLAVRVGGLI